MSKNAGALEFDSIQVNETAHLFGDTAKPACNLIINLAYASQSSDEKMKDSLNTYFLSACFGEKYMGMTPEEAVKKYTEKYVGDYRKDLEPMYRKDEQDTENAGEIGAWYSTCKASKAMCNCTPGICSFTRIDRQIHRRRIYMSTFLSLDYASPIIWTTCLPATTRSSSPTSFGTSLWRTTK